MKKKVITYLLKPLGVLKRVKNKYEKNPAAVNYLFYALFIDGGGSGACSL